MLIQYSTNSQYHILQIFNLNLLESFHDYLPYLFCTSKQHFYFILFSFGIYLQKYKKNIYIYIIDYIFFQ